MFGDLFFDYTLRNVALGAMTLGVVSGALGSFAVLRRQSLIGDAISHAALPGIAIAYWISRSRTSFVLMAGAAVAGWCGALAVASIVNRSRIKYDSALGIVLSVFFGIGLVLLTFLQRGVDAGQAGLENFLFGQAASLVASDVGAMGALGVIALTIMVLMWKGFKILSFDPVYGASLGLPMRRMDLLLTTTLVIAIVVGLQTVGVVLMSAMIVAPGVAARQWTDRLGVMVMLAGFFGALAGVTGAVFSASIERLPTGPTIVLCAGSIVAASLLLSPRGIVVAAVRRSRNKKRLQARAVLDDLYALSGQHDDPRHGHAVEALETMNLREESVRPSLEALARDGLAERDHHDGWRLTPAGRRAAERERGAEETP